MSNTDLSVRSTEELTAAADILYISIELFLKCLESDFKTKYNTKLDEVSIKKFANEFPALASYIGDAEDTYFAFVEELRKRHASSLN